MTVKMVKVKGRGTCIEYPLPYHDYRAELSRYVNVKCDKRLLSVVTCYTPINLGCQGMIAWKDTGCKGMVSAGKLGDWWQEKINPYVNPKVKQYLNEAIRKELYSNY